MTCGTNQEPTKFAFSSRVSTCYTNAFIILYINENDFMYSLNRICTRSTVYDSSINCQSSSNHRSVFKQFNCSMTFHNFDKGGFFYLLIVKGQVFSSFLWIQAVLNAVTFSMIQFFSQIIFITMLQKPVSVLETYNTSNQDFCL